MKNVLSLKCAALLLALCFSMTLFGQLRIASWNIRNCGAEKLNLWSTEIHDILTQHEIDIVFIQEYQRGTSTLNIPGYTAHFMDEKYYSSCLTEEGIHKMYEYEDEEPEKEEFEFYTRKGGNNETYLVLISDQKKNDDDFPLTVEVRNNLLLYQEVADANKIDFKYFLPRTNSIVEEAEQNSKNIKAKTYFSRPPGIFEIKYLNFEFIFLNYHAATNPENIESEYNELVLITKYLRKNYDYVNLVGDLNFGLIDKYDEDKRLRVYSILKNKETYISGDTNRIKCTALKQIYDDILIDPRLSSSFTNLEVQFTAVLENETQCFVGYDYLISKFNTPEERYDYLASAIFKNNICINEYFYSLSQKGMFKIYTKPAKNNEDCDLDDKGCHERLLTDHALVYRDFYIGNLFAVQNTNLQAQSALPNGRLLEETVQTEVNYQHRKRIPYGCSVVGDDVVFEGKGFVPKEKKGVSFYLLKAKPQNRDTLETVKSALTKKMDINDKGIIEQTKLCTADKLDFNSNPAHKYYAVLDFNGNNKYDKGCDPLAEFSLKECEAEKFPKPTKPQGPYVPTNAPVFNPFAPLAIGAGIGLAFEAIAGGVTGLSATATLAGKTLNSIGPKLPNKVNFDEQEAAKLMENQSITEVKYEVTPEIEGGTVDPQTIESAIFNTKYASFSTASTAAGSEMSGEEIFSAISDEDVELMLREISEPYADWEVSVDALEPDNSLLQGTSNSNTVVNIAKGRLVAGNNRIKLGKAKDLMPKTGNSSHLLYTRVTLSKANKNDIVFYPKPILLRNLATDAKVQTFRDFFEASGSSLNRLNTSNIAVKQSDFGYTKHLPDFLSFWILNQQQNQDASTLELLFYMRNARQTLDITAINRLIRDKKIIDVKIFEGDYLYLRFKKTALSAVELLKAASPSTKSYLCYYKENGALYLNNYVFSDGKKFEYDSYKEKELSARAGKWEHDFLEQFELSTSLTTFDDLPEDTYFYTLTKPTELIGPRAETLLAVYPSDNANKLHYKIYTYGYTSTTKLTSSNFALQLQDSGIIKGSASDSKLLFGWTGRYLKIIDTKNSSKFKSYIINDKSKLFLYERDNWTISAREINLDELDNPLTFNTSGTEFLVHASTINKLYVGAAGSNYATITEIKGTGLLTDSILEFNNKVLTYGPGPRITTVDTKGSTLFKVIDFDKVLGVQNFKLNASASNVVPIGSAFYKLPFPYYSTGYEMKHHYLSLALANNSSLLINALGKKKVQWPIYGPMDEKDKVKFSKTFMLSKAYDKGQLIPVNEDQEYLLFLKATNSKKWTVKRLYCHNRRFEGMFGKDSGKIAAIPDNRYDTELLNRFRTRLIGGFEVRHSNNNLTIKGDFYTDYGTGWHTSYQGGGIIGDTNCNGCTVEKIALRNKNEYFNQITVWYNSEQLKGIEFRTNQGQNLKVGMTSGSGIQKHTIDLKEGERVRALYGKTGYGGSPEAKRINSLGFLIERFVL